MLTLNHPRGRGARWRDSFNPLRGLTLPRVAALCEAYDRGEMAEVQWAFRAAERRDADLLALVERRTAAILEMDWTVREGRGRAARRPGRMDAGLAREQAAALREAYEGVDNLYEAIEHLSLAVFRGFAHAQKQRRRPDGDVTHLEPVDPWNVARDGAKGAWKYNPDSLSADFHNLPDDLLMRPADFVQVEHARPIDHLGLVKLARSAMGEKDWSAYVEIYGVPGGVVIMPEGVPPGQEEAYAGHAAAISEGASGTLPHGSEFHATDRPRGESPFRGYLDYLSEKLILAGTGGLLTMLAQSGSGTLAGGAHQDTFRQIARSHGRRLSEALQRQFDQPFLEARFPGRPHLAYFELVFQPDTNTGEVVRHAAELARGGYRVSAEELSDKTGYGVIRAA